MNARDAMPDGGPVVLSAREERVAATGAMAAGRYVCFSVTDTGTGMDEKTLSRIFEPFFSTKDYGTGLGLPIIGRIVDCLGGRIEIESTPEWQTVFAVYLPTATMETATKEISGKTAAIAVG